MSQDTESSHPAKSSEVATPPRKHAGLSVNTSVTQNAGLGLGILGEDNLAGNGASESLSAESSKRSSVYLPIDERSSSTTDKDSSWLFANHHVPDSGVDMPPKSPSMINPLYRERDSPPKQYSPFAPAMDSSELSDASHKRNDSIPQTTELRSAPMEINPSTYSNTSIYSNGHYQSPSQAGSPFQFGQQPPRPLRKPSRPFYEPNGSLSQPVRPSSQPSQTLFGMSPALQAKLDTPSAWLVYYFLLNLSLTLYNKLVLVKFPFPWALSVHTLCGAAGSYFLLQQGIFTQARLTRSENLTLVAFSVLYTVNIAISNLSLNLVTVPFHQVVRATTPVFTIALSIAFLHKRYSQKTYISLIPVVAGVGFATFGDYNFTALGFTLTILGTVLAALKTIVTNMIQVGRLKLHPLDLLLRMSPLAFVQCVLYSWWTGELTRVREYGATQMTGTRALALGVNGLFAFLLNIVSFSANKKTSALTMTVSANVKQVLTIILAVEIFDLTIKPLNLLGIVLTLAGGAWYGWIEFQQKKQRTALLGSIPLMEVKSQTLLGEKMQQA